MSIRIPTTDNKIVQPNNSDLGGNLWYSRNLNLDEAGYIKLSNRAVALASEESSSFVGQPLAWGRSGSGQFLLVTNEDPMELTITETALTATEDTDTDNPVTTADSWGTWWQNRWYVTENTDMKYKSSGTWNDPGVSGITSGKCHALEVFRNRTTLCIANGNEVLQIDTGHNADTTLTLPANYEVTALAYSNNKMGIVTKLSDTASYQSGEAYFFIWDGATAAANSGFPIGSDSIYAIAAYKSSWVILTRTGQLLYWNGGGFQELASLPFYYFTQTWGDPVNKQIFGAALHVEGDLIYININTEFNQFGNKYEKYLQNCPSGVLCYDPAVGLYHRYSPSISLASLLTVTSANVNTTSDILTSTAGTVPATGNPIKYVDDSITQIGGLKVGAVYYVIKHTSTTFSLAETKQDAIDGNKVDLTSTGASNNYFLALELVDYGATYAGRTGAIGTFGESNQVADQLLFGGEYLDSNSTTDYYTLCFTVPGFKNIGYFVTPKIISQGVEDTQQTAYIKYRPLKEEDKIILKLKDKDVIGLPATTPQATAHCSWTSSTTFTTTADLSEAEAYFGETTPLEVEITAGAGAGQLSQVSSIEESGGTYTVTLEEEIDGASSGRTCDIVIDNWKKVGEITSADTAGWKQFAINSTSKFTKYKVELRGVETTVEEFSVSTATHKPY